MLGIRRDGGDRWESDQLLACARCNRFFVPRFRFQVESKEGVTVHYCSQTCREPGLTGNEVACSCCGKAFLPTLAIHISEDASGRKYFCGETCRAAHMQPAPPPAEARRRPPQGARHRHAQPEGRHGQDHDRAVAGGRLRRAGALDPAGRFGSAGNVGVSLGMSSPRTVYHMLVRGALGALLCRQGARQPRRHHGR